jgi:transcriptional regulator with XRE-family HTH domain
MAVGTRIRDLRTRVGMSQSELARRVKLTQGTIAGLERGDSRSSSFLHLIARELGTTPAYLTGETDDIDADAPVPELSFEERHLIESFHILDRADKSALIRIVDTMARGATPAGATIHDRQLAYAAEGAGDR